jgi:prevent-host-death family protein
VHVSNTTSVATRQYGLVYTSCMLTVGAFEAKTNLSALLERVAQGESIRITRHGKPVARIVPDNPANASRDMDDVIEAIRRFRSGRSIGSSEIRSMVEEGRRF